MLNNIFFTIVFFILDHFLYVLIFNLISLIVMKYAYKKWHDKLLASDVRYYVSHNINIISHFAHALYYSYHLCYKHIYFIFP